ncbi:MAG: hypothetical protein DRJ09_00190 [Bacteroidetes bacterium]|nr:MAG: hypothetical protein DRJ09_00190 [Bacteroidota bacterium]
MKNKFSLVFIILFSSFINTLLANSADTIPAKNDTVKALTFTGLFYTGLNQIGFVNWAAGGENSLSGKMGADYSVSYKKNKFKFHHQARLAYGLVGYMDKRVEKTDDKIDLLMTLGRVINKKWTFTGLVTFKSQFAPGYKYPDDSTLISDFMAPGYLTLSMGINYSPIKEFQIFVSPVSGKFIFVENQGLADKGSFGVTKAVTDSAGNILVPGKNAKGELGLNLVTSWKYNIMKNINLNTTLNLHNNYIDPNKYNRWNIDVDWDNRFIFTINKLFSTVFYFHLKYDDESKTTKYGINDEGKKVVISSKPMVQIKESLGLSITLKI